ncbi:MAG: hypothetical protein HOM55_10945 [Proteobacteria bacterium]|jgi:hypothetical protein|nr:hypothetical protein [Pseudomonadota bacterium]
MIRLLTHLPGNFPLLLLVSSLIFMPSTVHAAHDCSVIYDEFESLMHKRFLLRPGDYLPIAEAQLNEFDFAVRQQGAFLLYEERGDAGILLFRTGENRYGKLLYRWSDPLPGNKRHLLILEGLYYEAVASGLVPTRFGPLRVSANMGVDLDTWQLVAVDQTVLDRRVVAMQEAFRLAEAEELAASDPFADAFSSPEVINEELVAEELIEDQVGFVDDEQDITDREGMIETDFSILKTEADLLVWQDEVGIYYVGETELGQATFPLESMCEFGTTDFDIINLGAEGLDATDLDTTDLEALNIDTLNPDALNLDTTETQPASPIP